MLKKHWKDNNKQNLVIERIRIRRGTLMEATKNEWDSSEVEL